MKSAGTHVLMRIIRELVIILGATVFFLMLCATVGISTSTPPTSPTAEAAYEREPADEELSRDLDLDWRFEAPVSAYRSD